MTSFGCLVVAASVFKVKRKRSDFYTNWSKASDRPRQFAITWVAMVWNAQKKIEASRAWDSNRNRIVKKNGISSQANQARVVAKHARISNQEAKNIRHALLITASWFGAAIVKAFVPHTHSKISHFEMINGAVSASCAGQGEENKHRQSRTEAQSVHISE